MILLIRCLFVLPTLAFVQGDRRNTVLLTSLNVDSIKIQALYLVTRQKRRQKREFSSVGLLTAERTGEGIEKFPANILFLAGAFQHLRVRASVKSSRDLTHERHTIPVGICFRPSRTEQGCGTRRRMRSTYLERFAQGVHL